MNQLKKILEPENVAGIISGLINGIILIVIAMALSGLIFTGPLEMFLPQGIGILLFGFLAYSIFEIEIRYALYAVVGLSLYSVFVINNIKKFEIIKPVLKPILLILFVTNYFYLLFSHSIY